ncbi:hypothetical protein GPN2_14057 [Streptomyces murinus]
MLVSAEQHEAGDARGDDDRRGGDDRDELGTVPAATAARRRGHGRAGRLGGRVPGLGLLVGVRLVVPGLLVRVRLMFDRGLLRFLSAPRWLLSWPHARQRYGGRPPPSDGGDRREGRSLRTSAHCRAHRGEGAHIRLGGSLR